MSRRVHEWSGPGHVLGTAPAPFMDKVAYELENLREALCVVGRSISDVSKPPGVNEFLSAYLVHFGTETHRLALELVAKFYDRYRSQLRGKCHILSALASVFVDEGDFVGEYNKVCYDISETLKTIPRANDSNYVGGSYHL